MRTEVILKNRILKSGSYTFDVYDDGKNLHTLTLPTGEVHGNRMKVLSCGCCIDYENEVWNWEDLNEDLKDKILDSIK